MPDMMGRWNDDMMMAWRQKREVKGAEFGQLSEAGLEDRGLGLFLCTH